MTSARHRRTRRDGSKLAIGSLTAAPAPAELSPLLQDEKTQMARLARAFLEKYDAPALSVAIGWRGKIVYSEAFGFSDLEARRPATTDNLFRIASLSKPLTSAALFTLIEAGRLSLNDRVFGPGSVLGVEYGWPPYSPGVDQVQIHHLMTHTAGGWANDQFDPMFRLLGLDHAGLIRHTLGHRPLDHPPGRAYAYSNFGYCVLGRVIEKLSRASYAEAVTKAVLRRCKVSSMRIAGNTREERAAEEVIYYSDRENPYGMNVRRMDAHGGWLARPEDYVRFLMRVSRFSPPTSLLKPSTIDVMTSATIANRRYAKGWEINPQGDWWHTGSLPGTSTIGVRAHNGFCWAGFINTRRIRTDLGGDLNRLIWNMLDAARSWRV
jgi:CubicO group peptidase (beta-lactamase class C family)